MFIDWKMHSIKFLAGVLLGLMTVQVLAQVDYDPYERTTNYDDYDSDVEIIDYGNGVTDSYNWDTNEYQDVEVVNDLGNGQVEVYNYDTGEYQIIDTCC